MVFGWGNFPVTQQIYRKSNGINPSFSDSPMADAGNDLPVNNVFMAGSSFFL